MSDDGDITSLFEEQERMAALAHHAGFELEKGEPGECELCGRWFGRLVNGACARCRESYEKRN